MQYCGLGEGIMPPYRREVSKIAEFERSSGIYVNPVPPEVAAAELRKFCLPPKD